jgi:putative FmdB family regulatory protein
MPLYEYHCSKCDKNFEILQKFSDPPVTVHEGCGGAVERVLSAPAFQLKGSGWYITDYGKAGSKPPEGASDKKSEAKAASSSEAKPEAKSESKSESKSSSESKAPAKSE